MPKFLAIFFGLAALSFSLPATAEVVFPTKEKSREAIAYHLLNRMAFGPRAGEVEELTKAPGRLEAWFAAQLNPESINDADLEKKLLALTIPRMSTEAQLEKFKRVKELIKAQGLPDADAADDSLSLKKFRQEHSDILPRNITFQLSLQKIIRAVESKREFQEVLADFWFNHFNVNANKARVNWLLTSYERDAIRPHLFGKFRDLLQATAHHPAMLMYLDNWRSVRNGFVPPRNSWKKNPDDPENAVPSGINENYARELLELHTLGVDGGYSQQDIIELARALTGWTIDRPNKSASFIFRPRAHDAGDVVILGQKFSGTTGIHEGELILDYLAGHPATAKFLAKKLCIRFVREPAPPSCIDRVAKKYLATDGDLSAVYQELFTGEDFWDPASVHQKVKRPFDFLISSLRTIGATIDTNQDMRERNIVRVMQGLGEPLYACVPPTGYKEEAAAWVNTGALVSRLRTAMALSSGRWDSVHWDLNKIFPFTPGDAAIDTGAERILGRKLEPATKQTMEKILTGNDHGIQDRELRNPEQIRLLALLLGSPEFQRR